MSVVENLIRDYGDFHLDIHRWEISDRGVTALWGPSGSGKTSVFRVLIGLDSCPTLRWVLQGQNLASLKIEDRNLGVVFQSYELFPHLSARGNLQFATEARKMDKNQATDKIQRLVDRLGLNACADRPAHLLSGGEKQRAALARALVTKPRFLLLDEPFNALDENLRADSRRLVKEVLDEEKIPALLITHDERDLHGLADHVQKIQNGQLA